MTEAQDTANRTELYYKLGSIEASVISMSNIMSNQFRALEEKLDASTKRNDSEISKLEIKLDYTDKKISVLESTFANYKIKASVFIGIVIILWAVFGDAFKQVVGNF